MVGALIWRHESLAGMSSLLTRDVARDSLVPADVAYAGPVALRVLLEPELTELTHRDPAARRRFGIVE